MIEQMIFGIGVAGAYAALWAWMMRQRRCGHGWRYAGGGVAGLWVSLVVARWVQASAADPLLGPAIGAVIAFVWLWATVPPWGRRS